MTEREQPKNSYTFIESKINFGDAVTFADEIAVDFSLPEDTAVALRRFAAVTFRTREVHKDFAGTKLFKKRYLVGVEEDKAVKYEVSRINYRRILKAHKKMAGNLYKQYFKDNENASTAAHQVSEYIKGLDLG